MTSVSTTDFGSWSAGQNSFSADEPNDALIVDHETKNSGRQASRRVEIR
jgi:hypothetical protein